MSGIPSMRRSPLASALLVACATGAAIPSTTARAQATGTVAAPTSGSTRGRFSTGLLFERVSFGDGILEADLGGADSSRVLKASNIAVPIGLTLLLGNAWSFDASSSWSSGTRTDRASSATGADTATRDATLSGLGDVRVRLTRRFDRTGWRLTLGANLPTGITELDDDGTRALSVLGSPALGLTQPSVGFGAGATVGIVKSFAAASRQWGAAFGASYEWRGEYEPFAALASGTSVNGYDPGEVIRLSAGLTRLLGESRALLTASVDLFNADKVGGTSETEGTAIKIGPTVAVDAQWQPATRSLRNAAVFGALRVRSALQRDGITLEKSGNVVFEGGARGGRALSRTVDLLFELSGRVITAVEIDNRLATAASTSVAPALGLAFSSSSWTVQPMLSARVGNVDTGLQSGGFTALGARLMFERRW